MKSKKVIQKGKRNISFFPPEKELEKVCEEMSAPNYPRVNMGLPEYPTPLEVSKHGLCKKILTYKQDNKLTTEELAQQINLTIPEVEDILFARIDKFTMDRLMTYASNLFPFHLAIQEDQPKRMARGSTKTKSNIIISRKINGRLRKHL